MLRWAIVGVTTFIIDYSIFITLYGAGALWAVLFVFFFVTDDE